MMRLAAIPCLALLLCLCPSLSNAEVIVTVFDHAKPAVQAPVKKPSFLKRLFGRKDPAAATAATTPGRRDLPEAATPARRTPVKLDFIPTAERQKREAKGYTRLKTSEGVYGVEGHGTPTHMICKTGQPMDAMELSQWIKNDRRYKTGMTVHLLACETGQGAHPFAQQVADILHAPVVAPTEKLWVHKDGHYSVSGAASVRVLGLIPIANGQADPDRPGEMKTFRPAPRDGRM